MALLPYTVTALSRTDIAAPLAGDPAINIVAGAIVRVFDLLGVQQTIYDDDAGTNGQLQKVTNSDGQTTFFIGPGSYVADVNGNQFSISIANASKVKTAVQPVNSIADLRGLEADFEGQQISLSGYYSDSLEGGGIFVWDAASTAADDGGVTFAVAGVITGRWVRQLDGFVTGDMFGIQSGIDCSDQIEVMLNYHSENKVPAKLNPAVNHIITRQLDFTPASGYVDFDGNGAPIDATGIPAGTTGNQRYVFTFNGTQDTPVIVSNDVTEGASQITGVGTISLAQGDLILIKSDQTFVDGYANANAKRGELQLVKSAVAGTITLQGKSYFSYLAASNLTVTKINPLSQPKIKGLKITCSGEGSVISGIKVSNALEPDVSYCVIDGAEDSGIQTFYTWNGQVHKCVLSNITSPEEGGSGSAWSSGYGIVAYEASYGLRMFANSFINCRRAITGGGVLPALYCKEYNNYATGGLNAFGNHEPCLDWEITNNIASGIGGRGLTIRGQKTKANYNKIKGCGMSGVQVRSFYNGTLGIRDVELIGNEIEDCGGNGIWLEGTAADGRVENVTISGGFIRNCAFNLIYGTRTSNVTIDDVDFGSVKSGTSGAIDGNIILFRGSSSLGDICSNIKIGKNRKSGKPLRNGLSFRYTDGISIDQFDMHESAPVYGFNFEFCNDVNIVGGKARAPDTATSFLHPIYFTDCNNITVNGTKCYGFAGTANVHGVRVQAAGTSVDHVINNCQMFDCDKAVSIVSAGSNHSVVTGNNGRNCTSATKFDVVSVNRTVANNLS